jgi:integrase
VRGRLQVVENWNSANGVVFYGKEGDLAGPDKEHQEVSMLALHLLQAATVHVNTLLVQRVLSEPAWTRRLTDEDRRGITALFCPTSAPTAPSSSTWTSPRLRPGSHGVSSPVPVPAATRTPPKRKARQLAKHLRSEHPDYTYLKAVFRHLRDELDIEVQREPKRLPYVPTEAEIRRYYEVVWTGRRGQDIVLIKTLLFTGVRVSELVRIHIDDVDLDACRIRITQGKGAKDRTVPFPSSFKETLALHIDAQRATAAAFLFESSWKKPYSTGGGAGAPCPLRGQGRPRAQHAPAPTAAFLVHVAEDPGHRRRPDPALLRPRFSDQLGDLLPHRPRRRSGELRQGDRPLPSMTDAVATLPLVTRTRALGHIERPLAELVRMDLVAALAFGGGH